MNTVRSDVQYNDAERERWAIHLKALANCFPCVLMQVSRSLDEWNGSNEEKFEALRRASKSLEKAVFGMKPTELSKMANDAVKTVTGVADLYVIRKKKLNEAAKKVAKDVVNYAESTSDSLKVLAIAAILGNHLDLGVKDVEMDEEFLEILKEKTLAVNDFGCFKKKLETARRVLYILDNTGEVIFDKVFIEKMENEYELEVTVAVRSAPIINDVTLKEALEVGFERERIVESGTTMAGMDMKMASVEFTREWENADLIISKGQGNFEGLDEVHDERLFFFLEAKCPVIANILNVNVGDAVLVKWK